MQQLQLSIPEPCHENWQQMTPTDQGRFCNACAKEVVDFSAMSDIQVLNYFTNVTHEKVCGRALPEQLDRAISRPVPAKKRLFWYWNYIVMFLLFFTKGNAAKAQGEVKPITVQNPGKDLLLQGQMMTNRDVVIESSRVISGSVKDSDGREVPFASVKIKGSPSGVSADANGVFTIKVQSNNVLVISGTGFKPIELSVGTQSTVNAVLIKNSGESVGEVVVSAMLGRMQFGSVIEEYYPKAPTKCIAEFVVKEDDSEILLDKAKITIISNAGRKTDTAVANKKGVYKSKELKGYYNYSVKVEADGYEPSEFVINGDDFKDRKKQWEVFLRKQKVIENKKAVEVVVADAAKPNATEKIKGLNIAPINTDTSVFGDPRVTMRGAIRIESRSEPLIVVDGIPSEFSPISALNPNDIERIEVLKSKAASILYGQDGINGAIIVTTKKLKVKSMDTVSVTTSRMVRNNSLAVGGMTVGVVVKQGFADSIKLITTKINGAIKIYPNPAKRGEQFNISLKIKEAGLFKMQITDATGRIFLQKQFIALAKEHAEKIAVADSWVAGMYYISIIDKNNQLISKKNFIVQ